MFGHVSRAQWMARRHFLVMWRTATRWNDAAMSARTCHKATTHAHYFSLVGWHYYRHCIITALSQKGEALRRRVISMSTTGTQSCVSCKTRITCACLRTEFESPNF